MKYGHVVKVNGVFYPAGVEVPSGEAKKAEPKAEAPVEKKQPTLKAEKKDK